jgi:hypothetical protein
MKGHWLDRREQRLKGKLGEQRFKEKLVGKPRASTYPFIPLEQTDQEEAEVAHSLLEAIQYEIYIPAKVWDHRAVIAFRDTLVSNGFPGATILKTAIGLWEGVTEDTHIYRTIVSSDESNAEESLRHWLQEEIGKTMAILAEWVESRQEEILFTENKIYASKSKLIKPAKPKAPRKPQPPKHEDEDA